MRRRFVRRVLWGPVLAAAAATGTSVALAASLTVTSARLTVTRTCVLSGRSDDSLVIQDAMVKQSGGLPQGGNNNLEVQSQTPSNNQRVYVRFDLTACRPVIGPTATVATATLRLYNRFVEACRTYDVFRATAGWTEGTILWSNQPFGPASNNPPTAQRTAAATAGGTGCTYPTVGYVAWNVTPDVGAFVRGTASNYGWMIRDDAESNASVVRVNFVPKELASTSSPAPQLVVTYTG